MAERTLNASVDQTLVTIHSARPDSTGVEIDFEVSESLRGFLQGLAVDCQQNGTADNTVEPLPEHGRVTVCDELPAVAYAINQSEHWSRYQDPNLRLDDEAISYWAQHLGWLRLCAPALRRQIRISPNNERLWICDQADEPEVLARLTRAVRSLVTIATQAEYVSLVAKVSARDLPTGGGSI